MNHAWSGPLGGEGRDGSLRRHDVPLIPWILELLSLGLLTLSLPTLDLFQRLARHSLNA